MWDGAIKLIIVFITYILFPIAIFFTGYWVGSAKAKKDLAIQQSKAMITIRIKSNEIDKNVDDNSIITSHNKLRK